MAMIIYLKLVIFKHLLIFKLPLVVPLCYLVGGFYSVSRYLAPNVYTQVLMLFNGSLRFRSARAGLAPQGCAGSPPKPPPP